MSTTDDLASLLSASNDDYVRMGTRIMALEAQLTAALARATKAEQEVERLRREYDREPFGRLINEKDAELAEIKARRCADCQEGWSYEETPEFGVWLVYCRMFNFIAPTDDFHCAAWMARRQEAT